ncbi:hypothetical protein CXT76_00765 [Candidatus Parvarchaeota archaeon]|jgi:thiol-disulfide isomerase/thioredoxin|nr:MAG: hypothetical protein CXT76_00765 [Candidatus Parvarchaeota archaeon]HIG52032.1 hypothetical protein [Candidatus Pacearchaeota archaeon]
MNKTFKIILGIVLVVFLFYLVMPKSDKAGISGNFAKCLSDNGAKMYGASWCGACKKQKEIFGSSFKHVNYIECASSGGGQSATCSSANIEAYPTWEFSDGSRTSSVLGVNQLAQLTGCSLE